MLTFDLQDRPWNDPGPRRGRPIIAEPDKPTLKAIILDLSSVNNVDVTVVQHLIDVRNQLDRYASPAKVDWHFACINNRWTKRALASAGFGYPTPPSADAQPYEPWKAIFSVAEIGGSDSAAAVAGYRENEMELRRQHTKDEESRLPGAATTTTSTDQKDGIAHVSHHQHDAVSSSSGSDLGKELSSSRAYHGRVAVVQGLSRPLFHVDLTSALQSAITNVEVRGDAGVTKGMGY